MEVVVAVATVKVGTVLNVSHWINELKRLFAEWTLVWFGSNWIQSDEDRNCFREKTSLEEI
jgi:hypothetical protein